MDAGFIIVIFIAVLFIGGGIAISIISSKKTYGKDDNKL